ncbi:DksA protein [Pseudomonas frederiksbergensis]|uniref:DksA protein n=1 Tax=Pseudomonas frederiksbergensis TaxID=104087 RepID=A0A1J0EES0_9PSED|nr:TraR/DksA C4-type zinc finger protein [Pseudomonas frederiksbergensis]APC14542.1 DksA protein [Pseudomonas frederiksbergensis]
MDVAEHATDEDDTEEAIRRACSSELQRRSGRSAYRCEECGDAIPEDRRQAEPGAEHCFDCLDALEHLATRGFR